MGDKISSIILKHLNTKVVVSVNTGDSKPYTYKGLLKEYDGICILVEEERDGKIRPVAIQVGNINTIHPME